MANGVDSAIATASRLDEIGFPEFTTKLISDVFDALIAANLRQQAAYVELLQGTAKTLQAFINDTKDDIGAPEILQFLAAIVPPTNPDSADNLSKVVVDQTLTAAEVSSLNTALATPTDAGVNSDNKVATAAKMTAAQVDKIMEAVAIRVTANKYDLLRQMVQQGALRLVVEDGVVETRLSFRTYGADYFSQTDRSANRKSFAFRAKAKTGGFLSRWVKAQASTSYTNVTVRTIDTRSRAVTNTNINIFGGVKINFRTDYLPLNQP